MEMLQTILVVVLLAIWLLFSVVFLITAIQNLINDHKREIRNRKVLSVILNITKLA